MLGSVAKCSWKAPIPVIQQSYNGKLGIITVEIVEVGSRGDSISGTNH